MFKTRNTSGHATVINVNGDYYDAKDTDHPKKRRIHKWMKPPDTSPNYNEARNKHQAGTGAWLIDRPEFSRWKEQAGSVLWLYGGPGCGKTILWYAVLVYGNADTDFIFCSSSVIENVISFCELAPSARGYAYFFFDGTRAQSDALNYNGLIRSIITQLSDRCDNRMPNVLVEMYNKCDDGHREPLKSQFQNTLSGILKIFDSTYIVIDALDECITKTDLLKWIRSVTAENSTKLHLMFTSRPEPDIEHGLAALSNIHKVFVGHQSTLGDIDAYLNARLQSTEMDKWCEPEKQEVKSTLSNGSGGMFRWVSLQMDAVTKCHNRAQLTRQLATLPKDLDATYKRLFEESDHADALVVLLQWLVFSESPMTVQTLAEVLMVDFNESSVPVYNILMRYKRPADLLHICYGLVTEYKGTVKVAHFSVKEYFIKHIASKQLSHSVIAQICLAQLLHFDRPKIIDWDRTNFRLNYIESSFPLAPYAALNWVFHFHSSGAASTHCPPLHQLLTKLFTLPSTTWSYALTSWVRLQNLVIKAARVSRHDLMYESNLLGRTLRSFNKAEYLPYDASPLFYACFSGSLHAVQHLVSDNAHVDQVDCEASTRPLLISCEEGHFEIARVLLDSGANVNSKGGRYGMTLQAACVGGHLELAKLLVERGADVNFEGGKHGTALRAACAGLHFSTVALLLDSGANINVEVRAYGTVLREACVRGHLELAKLLLEKGADVNVVERSRGTALQAVCERNYLELAKLLLEKGANVNFEEGGNGTVLQAACAKGHCKLAMLLLEKGADVDAEGGKYGTALQAAAAGSHLELAKLLLERGADINFKGGKHGTALRAACTGLHLDAVVLLLDRGADVNTEVGAYGTVLWEACSRHRLKLAKLLLEKGADVNVERRSHGTALQEACARGYLKFIGLLLDQGANVNLDQREHGTVLQSACARGDLELAKLLLERGADINFGGRGHNTPLRAAWVTGHLELVKLLLEKGAHITLEKEETDTVLQQACAGGHLELTKLLLERGADVNSRGRKHGMALREACVGHHSSAVALLLDSGADANVKGAHGTVLQEACARGHLELARLLLEKGADVNFGGRGHDTPLRAAWVTGHLELVKLLLEKGAHVTLEKEETDTVLQQACAGGHLELTKLLLERGADVNSRGRKHGMALREACVGHHLSVVALLLDSGVDANVKGAHGTVFQEACARGHLELARLLLERGANVNSRRRKYDMALREACAGHHLSAVALLLDSGADTNVEGAHGPVLQEACARGRLELARLLLEKGADVNFKGGKHGTALRAACAGGGLGIAILLLEKGADVNCREGIHGTALQAACAGSHFGVAALLLDSGANVTVETCGLQLERARSIRNNIARWRSGFSVYYTHTLDTEYECSIAGLVPVALQLVNNLALGRALVLQPQRARSLKAGYPESQMQVTILVGVCIGDVSIWNPPNPVTAGM
ncbi:hypothetical protein HWV62_29505 [Athelia sp. TMB]|nr:hypothetical protein HWV62_29505 [Athelia sp. TMB]